MQRGHVNQMIFSIAHQVLRHLAVLPCAHILSCITSCRAWLHAPNKSEKSSLASRVRPMPLDSIRVDLDSSFGVRPGPVIP